MFNGVTTEVTVRTLSGSGWNVAARSTTGGFGAWLDDVHAVNDTHLDLTDVFDVDPGLAVEVADRPFGAERTVPIGEALVRLLDSRPRSRIERAREVAALSAEIERNRSVTTVGQLARLGGVTARTLQRMYTSCAGVSPTWVIRRHRLIDAADRVRDGRTPDWAQLAVDLEYADQAHLTRDFTATIGMSPGAYAAANRSE
nr:AraC family transcriptional regulator [Gordonia humi]